MNSPERPQAPGSVVWEFEYSDNWWERFDADNSAIIEAACRRGAVGIRSVVVKKMGMHIIKDKLWGEKW